MLSNDLQQIILLNPVKINYDLKKWNPENTKDTTWSTNGTDGIGMSNGSDIFPSNSNIWDGVPFKTRRIFSSPFWKAVAETYIRFRMVFTKPKKDPVDIFMDIKGNFSSLENVDVDDTKMRGMISNLEQTKQKYAIATLLSDKTLKILENKLVELGFTQYQTEESLIKFIKQCPKGLCLQEIEYFDRVIPEDVMQKFEVAEATKLFDNYYILFYDPKNGKNIFYTQEKPKDPIMFGVIRGSNKLYFVADWIDEFCNLTYKDILKQGVDYKLSKTEE